MARMPRAIAQQASGLRPSALRNRQARGAVPVARATCTAASAMPAPNQVAYDGSHIPYGQPLSRPVAMATSQPTVTGMVAAATATARHGRHRRPVAATAITGRIR
ncbi:hypothetical protein GCM10027280_27690 [Micromonospora polyrhachis]